MSDGILVICIFTIADQEFNTSMTETKIIRNRWLKIDLIFFFLFFFR